MTDNERGMAADADEIEADAEQISECALKGPRWKRVLKRTAIGIGATLAFLVFAVVMLYNLGGPSGSVYPEMRPQFEQMVASGQAQPLRKRFVIPIPGCQCHSTDTVLTALHSKRHMNECAKCHNTNPAHNEPGVS
jgi:hypothetical protein